MVSSQAENLMQLYEIYKKYLTKPYFQARFRTALQHAPSNWACGPQWPLNAGWRPSMSIKTRFAAIALATLAVTGAIASTSQAQAKPLGLGYVGAGLVGAAIVGTAIAASGPGYYYDGYRRCGWVRQFDAFGNYIGRVRTCGY